MKCRICETETFKFLNLGNTPLANAFLKKEDLDKEEPKYPLELCYCNNCHLVQLSKAISGETLFKNYVYVSSTAKSFRLHFQELAVHLKKELKLNEHSLAVDIGSNDGVLLREYNKLKIPFIGVEPAENISKLANDEGLETYNSFFSNIIVKKIIEEKGKADIITACNVFAHIEQIEDVIKNVKELLKDTGMFVIEVQYFLDTVNTMTFDNVYHEHLFYYTIHSLDYLFKKHNMQIINIEHVNTHGGSVRVFIKKQGTPKQSYFEYLETEEKCGVKNIEWYNKFGEKVYLTKEKIVELIKELKKQNKTIFGYGAPAKASTLLNFCNIGNNLINYIIDDNPLKQDLFTPGNHIPVKSFNLLESESPDYIIVLAWNFAEPIIEKIKDKYNDKFKYIIPLPIPKIL